MIGIIAVLAWGAVRFVQTNTGHYVMSGVAWLISFATPAIPEGVKPEDVTGFAALPQVVQSLPAIYLVAGIIGLLGIWIAFRIVNMPRPAEFMIAVEAEMVKVSWPNKKEVYVTTIVVIVVMMIFCVLLAIYDTIWHYLFNFLGVI
jgi:preprotein translocase subunit SecE